MDFIEKKENLLLLGPPGVGKTHLAIAFGVKACLAKYRVLFIRTQDLLANLSVAHQTGRLGQVLLNLSRLDLLILDELGYLPILRNRPISFFNSCRSATKRGP